METTWKPVPHLLTWLEGKPHQLNQLINESLIEDTKLENKLFMQILLMGETTLMNDVSRQTTDPLSFYQPSFKALLSLSSI